MRIALCDDTQGVLDAISLYVDEWAIEKNRRRSIDVMQFVSVESFLFHWSATNSFNLIFLDITMGNMTGLELASIIRKVDSDISIVFVAKSRDYVLKGYEVEALYYMVKPVSRDDCFRCLDRAWAKLEQRNATSLVLSVDRKLKRIYHADIIYIESRSHYIDIHTRQGKVTSRTSISDVEAKLDPQQFFRIHRSFIVNLGYVKEIKGKDLTLEEGTVLPVSKVRQQDINRAFAGDLV